MSFGIDYAWGRPSIEAMRQAGVKFVCRYLSRDTTGKNLDLPECEKLSAAGIWIVVVWETTAQRALSGYTGGRTDAQEARRQAMSLGMPEDRPIYFAADWDASEGQQGLINAYLDGAAQVLGRHRVGLYGGYWPLRRALDAGRCSWGWQTYAWSGGHWDPRAQLQQYRNGVDLDGVDVDYDRATSPDYGQWRIGEGPTMALTSDDLRKIADAVWRRDEIPAPDPTKDNPTWKAQSHLTELGKALRRIEASLSGRPDVDEAAIVTGVLAQLTPERIAAHLADALPAELAAQVVDQLSARLSHPGNTTANGT